MGKSHLIGFKNLNEYILHYMHCEVEYVRGPSIPNRDTHTLP